MPKVFYCVVSCLILCLLFQLSLAANPPKKVKGKVVRIMDGDTFELLVNKTTYKIRLNAIDAPEKGQDYYERSKQALSSLIFNTTVTVELLRQDKFQRWVGEVYSADGQYVNGRMISDGYAWHYTVYSESAPLAAAQATAKKQRLGLWSLSKPVAPWEFRAEKRKSKPRRAA